MNNVTLVGRLAQDPETRTTQGGTKITNLVLVTERPVIRDGKVQKTSEGYTETDAEFHRITAFNGTGSGAAKLKKKGDTLAVVGRLHYSSWNDSEGTKRYGCEVIAENIEFC